MLSPQRGVLDTLQTPVSVHLVDELRLREAGDRDLGRYSQDNMV